jgi:uncharacterized membrane protein
MTDEKLEAMISTILRSGVLAAAVIVLGAGMLYLVQYHDHSVQYSRFVMENKDLRTLTGIFRSSLALQSEAMIQLGLLLLIATPIARVALAAIGFFLERDYLYVVVSIVVLAVLLFSLMQSA